MLGARTPKGLGGRPGRSVLPWRKRLADEERGQGLVEFAVILPLLLLLLVGVIEFGVVYSNIISLRQGIREAGRQGSVANFGNDPNCLVPGTILDASATGSNELKQLMCTAKAQVGVSDNVRIRIKFANNELNMPATTPAYKRGNAIVVCAIYPLSSLTGLFQPFLNGHFARTKAAFRIEKTGPTNTATDDATVNFGNPADGWGEDAPSGSDWDWCETP
jgi:hypothetical protein